MNTTTWTRLATDNLRTVLWANAVFSATSALTLLGLGRPIADWADVPVSLLQSLGLGIAGFAVYVAWAASRPALVAAHVRAIAVADMAWVAGAATVIAIPDTLPVGGSVALAAVSLVVLDLGVLEWLGQRRLSGP